MDDRKTIKISAEARRQARLIAAHTGEKQYQVIERLLKTEFLTQWANAGAKGQPK